MGLFSWFKKKDPLPAAESNPSLTDQQRQDLINRMEAGKARDQAAIERLGAVKQSFHNTVTKFDEILARNEEGMRNLEILEQKSKALEKWGEMQEKLGEEQEKWGEEQEKWGEMFEKKAENLQTRYKALKSNDPNYAKERAAIEHELQSMREELQKRRASKPT